MTLKEKNTFVKKIQQIFFQKSVERLYLVDIASAMCTEYTTDSHTPGQSVPYDGWMLALARDMYKTESAQFFVMMDLTAVCKGLEESDERYTVYFRTHKAEQTIEYVLECFYADESHSTLFYIQRELDRKLIRPFETLEELDHLKERFHFLVNYTVANFIEIRVTTGECHMFHPDNGMESMSTLKEQIMWWAENLIAPEQRDAYIKEFELDNLLYILRENDGYHSCIYSAIQNDCPVSLRITSTLHRDSFGAREEYIFAYAQDITDLREQEQRNKQLVDISQQLLKLSQTESMTGLYNRAAGEKFIEEHLTFAPKNGGGTLLLIDVDRFKDFNDSYGHQTGDYVLRLLGKNMQDVFRSGDILCRWGGDEFMVFLRGKYQKKSVESRIERLRARMKHCQKDDLKLEVTISIGGAVINRQCNLKSLFMRCDKSLYKVKESGRDGFYIDEETA